MREAPLPEDLVPLRAVRDHVEPEAFSTCSSLRESVGGNERVFILRISQNAPYAPQDNHSSANAQPMLMEAGRAAP